MEKRNGGVYISPNIKKTSDRIDTSGNIINKDTKEIIVPNTPEVIDQPVVNTPPEAPQAPQASSLSEKVESMVQAKIASKIDEIVDRKVAEILSKL